MSRMGIEYSLRFDAPDASAVADLVRRLTDEREKPDHRFDLGGDPAGWPAATFHVEPGGAYFCDYGGGRPMLGTIVAAPASFGPVTVEEL
jgi:hypothetical protein